MKTSAFEQCENKLVTEYYSVVEKIKGQTKIEKMAVRLPVQIEFIHKALKVVSELDGCIWEIGLGSGRTLELIEKLTKEPILVFEINQEPIPRPQKNSTKMIFGNFFETIPKLKHKYASGVKLIHADIGTSFHKKDLDTFKTLPEMIHSVVVPGGAVICDRPLLFQGFRLLSCSHTSGWPYYLWIKERFPHQVKV